jgi:hypothetical protein
LLTLVPPTTLRTSKFSPNFASQIGDLTPIIHHVHLVTSCKSHIVSNMNNGHNCINDLGIHEFCHYPTTRISKSVFNHYHNRKPPNSKQHSKMNIKPMVATKCNAHKYLPCLRWSLHWDLETKSMVVMILAWESESYGDKR